MEELPGKDLASALGFSLHSYAANRRSALYIRELVYMNVVNRGYAHEVEVSFLCRMLTVSTGYISHPDITDQESVASFKKQWVDYVVSVRDSLVKSGHILLLE